MHLLGKRDLASNSMHEEDLSYSKLDDIHQPVLTSVDANVDMVSACQILRLFEPTSTAH